MEHLAQVCSSRCGASTHVLWLVPSAETGLLNFWCPLSDWKPFCFPAPGRGMRCGKSWGLFQDGPPNTFSATFSRLARLPLFLWVRLINYSSNKKSAQPSARSKHWTLMSRSYWLHSNVFFFWIWFYPAAKSVLDTAHIPLSPHSWWLLATRVQPLIYLLLTLAFTKCLLKKETDTQPCRCL